MIDRPLFLATTALIVIGIIFSYSLSAYTVLLFNVQPWHFFIRQFSAGMIGIFLMWFIARQDSNKVATKIGFSIFIISALMMIAIPFLPESIAREVGGAKRWIRLGPLSLAPVEFFKIGFAYFIAWSFSRKVLPKHMERSKEFRYTLKEELSMLLPYFIIFIAVMFIIAIFQNDLGQVVLLALTLLGMMIFAGSSLKFFGASILVGAIAIAGFVVTSPHRIERFKGWYYMIQNSIAKIFPQWASAVPKVNLAEEPYQISNSLHAIHNGGLFGVGLGNGVLKLGFLSEVHTDFVLAGMAEEIGVLGVAAVVMLLMVVIFRLLKIAGRSDNNVNYLYCAGLAMIIGFAFLINALGISGVIPLKGIAVPFLSYGGSQIVAMSIGVGLALSMSKKVKM
ncbi:FtsW/RodA/SpoVE family cell cycle protein [Hydrogenimonas thermophila]|uniref:Probable peptidoglycan glycosyltransferase FtsW n=1 Tax=Hydrogenimonas thermophila TaxID=223786 RepID=A0A1I5P2R5_9BACT|nr:putative peptidoglycan glycosyltransferase FtsW [Hydrogenimonas thermophila]WOE69586.1 putative peptidoglycan glycosyltransferase FtsW [Hydrogenimonas thermophila]WOE72100.1 putative peptidoglycan glycosyltransferase FtsW [Hydrogenimonas thermophila]SFP28384.1 cell division protein FtsW [Hydrogenimonas thermophila]